MGLIRRMLLVLVVFALLCLGMYWIHLRFGLATNDTISLVGTLAVVVAVLGYVIDKRPKCHVSNAYATLGEHDGWVTFHFEAHILNSGNAPDTLQRVDYSFYHREQGQVPLSLIFGGRILMENRGQILPISLAPGITYFVETKEMFGADSPRGRQVSSRNDNDEYIFRCNFIFEQSRSVIVRVHPHDYTQLNRTAARRLEKRLDIQWMRSEPS
jgi:hypothetical protein